MALAHGAVVRRAQLLQQGHVGKGSISDSGGDGVLDFTLVKAGSGGGRGGGRGRGVTGRGDDDETGRGGAQQGN